MMSSDRHVGFALGEQSGFTHPWYFYLGRTWADLGPAGAVLAILGLGVVLCGWAGSSSPAGARLLHRISLRCPWMVCVILPAMFALSVLPAKVPWVIMVLFPAWATLQAVGLDRLLGRLSHARMQIALGVLLASGLTWAAFQQDYDRTLEMAAPGQRRGASYSRECADVMNRMVKDGDRVLLTSFHYWEQLPPGHACAVFAYYFERDVAVLLRSHESSFESLSADVKAHQLDWALLSPHPGELAQEVFGGFAGTLGLEPIKLDRACLFSTGRVKVE